MQLTAADRGVRGDRRDDVGIPVSRVESTDPSSTPTRIVRISPGSLLSANATPSTKVGSMLGQRRRRWANIKPTLGEGLVFTGIVTVLSQSGISPALGQRRVNIVFIVVNTHDIKQRIFSESFLIQY